MSPLTCAQLISNRLNPRLHYLRNVRVYNAVARQINATQFQLSYGNWTSMTSGFPVHYKNGQLFTPDAVDNVNGLITVNTASPGDEFTSTFEFTYFTDSDLTFYLLQAMSKLNNTPPASYFSLDDSLQGTAASYPPDFEDFLTNYAYKLCLEAVLVDLMSWRAKIIWTDPIALAGIVQGTLSSLDNSLNNSLSGLKGRRFLNPRSISQGRYSVPASVSDSNWQQYTIARSGG